MKNLGCVLSVVALFLGSVGSAAAQLSVEPAAADPAPEVPAAADPAPAASADAAAPTADAPAAIPVQTEAAPAEAAAAETPAAGGNRLIEEVIVTAQKREENIKDVPISIASFNADYLGAKGVVAQQDLPKITPGLTFSAPVGFSTAYIRGIGSDAFILADPLVVTYIDGVYFPASTTQFQDFGSVEKVEVDKGPQGTLFGRNALGGVISITTKDPSLAETKAFFDSTYINYTGSDPGRFAVNSSAALSVPLTDTLAIGVSGLYDADEPYYPDQVGPTNNAHRLIKSGRASAIRGKLLWKPDDDFKVKLSIYQFQEHDPQRNFAVNTDPSALGSTVQPQDPFKGGSVDGTPLSEDRGLTYFGSADWNTHYADIQLLGSHQKITAIRNLDFDSSPEPIAYFEAVDDPPNKKPFFANNQSLELRFLSNDSAPDWMNLVAGVYYFNQDSGIGGADFQGGGTDLNQGLIAGVSVPGLSSLISSLGLTSAIPPGAQLALDGALNDKSIAFYTQDTFKFTDWFSLTLGARYQQDKRYILYADQGVNLSDGTQELLFHYSGENADHKEGSTNNFNPADYRTHTNSFDPKISLNFRPGDGFLGKDPLLYLSYQTASTGNIFNAISLFAAPTLAIGSKIKAYETGLKTTLFDNLMSLDAAAFYYKETNAQSQVVSLQSGGAVHFENVPALRTVGADFNILAQILPSLTANGLVLTFSGAFLDSKYTKYPDASGFNPTTGVYSSTNDFTGHQVVQTPRFTTNVGLNQTIHIPGGPLEGGIDFYSNSGFYFLAQNTPNTHEPAYRTLGVTLSYLYEPWNTRVTLFGRNILNEHYYAARFTNDFGTDDFAAQLSTYGITIHWEL